AWIAMFGLKRESKGENDLDPALRLVGLVGFLIAGTGFLHVRLFSGDISSAGGILGKLVGNSLTVGFGALGAN
ncbi:DNA translocase FtsK 4TM domain-containing protein, partial [Staphylococcus aureus]